jgi:crotonobetainyl-CoA:carnitine CoA-transferase CaiB-like acyl-CoA transferase
MNGPLADLRVLDLSRVLAGPFATMILGDLGAEIIKVEMPGTGDDTRQWGPPFVGGESAYFLSINRNKKSITLNLKNPQAKEIAHKLAALSDMVIENFTPGVSARLGLDYETLRRINPKIIYCSISGFGQDGPYREWPSYDIVMQAMGGFMSITGEYGRPPVRIGVAVSDMIAGFYAVIALLAALKARDRTGNGQFIDISLFDATVSVMTYMGEYYFVTKENPQPAGSSHPTIVPYQAFKCQDGTDLIIAVGNDRHWELLCKTIETKDLLQDSRFAHNAGRVQNRDELIPRLQSIFLKWNRDDLFRGLIGNGVPCGPVYKMSELFADPQVLHRGMVVEMDHPKLGSVKLIGSPLKLSGTPVQLRTSPPMLGENTVEILERLLNYKRDEVKKLKEEGAI